MKPSDFPRLVYRSKDGKTFEHLEVKDQEVRDDALANGWSDTVPEALASAKEPAAPSAPAEAGALASAGTDAQPTRAELEEKARELGLSFQPNIGDKKLRQRIEIALQGRG